MSFIVKSVTNIQSAVIGKSLFKNRDHCRLLTYLERDHPWVKNLCVWHVNASFYIT